MTTIEVLTELLEETRERVFACAGNYLMTYARPGRERDFEHYLQREAILTELIAKEAI